MAKRPVGKATSKQRPPSGMELIQALQKSGIISSDVTLMQFMEASARMSNDEVAWTGVYDSGKYCFIMH